MKYISVCSGIEAATSAWHHMGWEPVAFSEIEPFPSAVLAHHYPTVPNWGDMTKFQEWPDACVCRKLPCNHNGNSGSRNDNAGICAKSERGRDVLGELANKGKCYECGGTIVNVLVGGTPCQSFSVAGLRKGLADPRGNLMLTFGAIAQRYRPKWLVWENVPGVLSSNGGRDFGAFLGMLAELGYGFAFRVLDAQYFGVAQRRRRVFVVGCLGDWRRAAAVLFERHSLSGHPAPSREARKDTSGSIGDCAANSSWPADIASTLNAAFGSKQGLEDQHALSGAPLFVPVQPVVTHEVIGTLNHSSGHAVPGNCSQDWNAGMLVPMAVAQPYIGGVDYENNAHGMDEATGPLLKGSPTGGGRPLPAIATAMQVRRLTPVECERLQGFTDGYTAIPWRNKQADQCPDGPRYKALGNSMAVPVMRWIGERIAAVDQVATPGLPAASAASAT